MDSSPHTVCNNQALLLATSTSPIRHFINGEKWKRTRDSLRSYGRQDPLRSRSRAMSAPKAPLPLVRSSSRRSLRRASRSPSLDTVWEWDGRTGEIVESVPTTEDVLAQPGAEARPRGRLWLRQTSWFPVRFLLGRRPFQQRYAVLTGGSGPIPPRLQLFLVRPPSPPSRPQRAPARPHHPITMRP